MNHRVIGRTAIGLAVAAAALLAVTPTALAGPISPGQAMAHPTQVTTSQGPNGALQKTYTLSWSIPPRKMFGLPAFSCPAETPYVRAGEPAIGSERYWRLDASLSATGQLETRYIDSVTFGPQDPNDGYYRVTGWPKGNFNSNYVVTGPFSASDLKITVTCTNDYHRAARSTNNQIRRMFPWQ
jgi:hypothetical protein